MVQSEIKKVVAVLPKGGPAAENPDLNCVENGLGLRRWLSEDNLGIEYIVTDDKDRKDSGWFKCF